MVPVNVLVCSRFKWSFSCLLMPKSLILARPKLDSTKILSGLTSLWICLSSL